MVAVVTLVAITAVLNSHLVFGDCSNFQGQDMCQGNQTDEPDIRNLRRWQTPPRNDSTWLSTYQDYNSLVGYAQVQYDSSHTAAIVTVYTLTKENSTKLSFSFNGRPATDVNFIKLDSSFTDPVQIVVTASSGARLELDDVDLLWNNPEVKQGPQYLNGQKGAIVELFGWPYTDIAAECDAIAKMGYMGVKVFPPQESVMSFEWLQNGELNPWYIELTLFVPLPLFATVGTSSISLSPTACMVGRAHGSSSAIWLSPAARPVCVSTLTQ